MSATPSSEHPGIRALAGGALAGLGATVTMTAVLVLARRLGGLGDYPPQHLLVHGLVKAGLLGELDPEDRRPIGWIAHAGYGAAAGAAYGAVRDAARRRRRFPGIGQGVITGLLWGLGVWAVSYLGWVPLFRRIPPRTRDPEGRTVPTFAAHVVFGASLGALYEATVRR